jgi:hypothetical protein
MKLQRALSAKILIAAFLNLVLLTSVFLVFARVHTGSISALFCSLPLVTASFRFPV